MNEKKETDIIKDRECIHCVKMFTCKGKPRGTTCVCMEERKENGGETDVFKKTGK